MSKNSKRILSVTVKRMIDTDPDTSWLGEYSDRQKSEFAIDRAHSEDCILQDHIQCEKLTHIADAIESDRPICEDHPQFVDNTCPICLEESAYTAALEQVRELAECDCSRGGHWNRREYRYFNSSFNYVTKDGKPADGLTPEDVRKYVRQDYERMESLNAGYWGFIGIRADAKVQLTGDLTQKITSGGLWGIESDSDDGHLEETEKEELSDLKTQLLALGFSKRAISTAFKNVEHEEE